MKNIYFSGKIIVLIMIVFTSPFLLKGQTVEQKKVLLEQYDIAKINTLQVEFAKKAKTEKEKAILAARDNQWEIFKFNVDGVKEGEPVFVIGNPGTTERYRTTKQLEYDRDYRYNMQYEMFTNRIKLLEKEYAAAPSAPALKRWDDHSG